jgi:hypothetical protein
LLETFGGALRVPPDRAAYTLTPMRFLLILNAIVAANLVALRRP